MENAVSDEVRRTMCFAFVVSYVPLKVYARLKARLDMVSLTRYDMGHLV